MLSNTFSRLAARSSRTRAMSGCCHWFEPQGPENENVWQVDTSSLRFGRGALEEAGEALQFLGSNINTDIRRVAVITDKAQTELPHVYMTVEAIRRAGMDPVVFDEIQVEPTDTSFMEAAAFAAGGSFDAFVSVGGGSVMDTCKAANLYSTYPADLLEYVNPPIGRGTLVPGPLKPHVACPTTAGTGSECTGLAIFDLTSLGAKTGIATRRIRPELALIDPIVMETLPSTVTAASGFDVLSHALESYTARPFTKAKRPATPTARPMSQGSNPWSDMGCEHALKMVGRFLVRAVNDSSDEEARTGMLLAATCAGISFGNAGCAIPHALSYSVSHYVRDFLPEGYPQEKPIIPHGYSVILNAPSAFRFTGHACPDRHLQAAEWLGADIRGVDPEDAGEVLALQMIELMQATGIPNGLASVGYSEADVPQLTEGAMPQRRLLDNAPCHVSEEDVHSMYGNAMKYW